MTAGRPLMARRWPKRLAASGLATALALAAAEVALRFGGFGAYAPRESEYALLRDHGAIWWRFDPQRPTRHRWDGDPYGRLPPGAEITYEIGPHGFRGDPPAPGRPVVLVVGDSFTFGEGVRLADTFVARLERAFAHRSPAPCFVNAGVPGYGTREEAARLPSLLEAYRPAAVLVVAVPNDAVPNDDAHEADDLVRTKDAGAPRFRLAALLRHVAGVAAQRRDAEEWYRSYYVGARRGHADEVRSGLASMEAAARERGAKYGVALFPLLYRVAARPLADVHDVFRDACAARGTPYLDLTDALAAERDAALWVHPTDQHPSARAHELAAEALVPFVARLLP